MDNNIIIPKVSIIMSAYNSSDYIQEAIDSVILQTFINWELIIIDDGSTDSTTEIISKNCKQDSRIKSFYQENRKQSKARNLGISYARGEYIAILDSDDIILPERLAKQIDFLDNNLDVVLCGSNFSIIGSDKIIKLPENHEAIKLSFLKVNCIAHSTVIMRKQSLDVFFVVYDDSKIPAEDYDLYIRLLNFGKLHNLQECLLKYRVHTNQVSSLSKIAQNKMSTEIRYELLCYLDFEQKESDKELLIKLYDNDRNITFDEINYFLILKEKMILANADGFFDSNGFLKYLNDLQKQSFKNYFLHRESYSPKICFQYFESRNKFEFKLKLLDELKLIIKSIIFFNKK